MISRSKTTGRLLFTVASAMLLTATSVDAQVRRGRAPAPEAPPWAPVAIGARAGYDQTARGQLVGAHVRIPVLRNGQLELNPNVERIFLRGDDETAYNLDVSYVPGGVRGGLTLGVGVGWRDTVIGFGETTRFFGYNVVVAGKTYVGPVQLEAAIRWALLRDTTYDPNSVSLGVNYVLWDPRPDR